VLTAVVLFWVIAMFGGLSLLNNNQPPMATLTWMLFVYAAAVLTPLAGVLAAVNLVRRWQRNRQYAQALAEAGIPREAGAAFEVAVPEEAASADEPETAVEPVSVAEPEPASVQREQPRPSLHTRPVPQQPAQQQPAQHQPKSQPAQHQPKSQPLKKQGQAKQRKKAA
jgi:hypothetical protein